MKLLLAASLIGGSTIYGDVPFALIGGQDDGGTAGYAALVFGPNNTVLPVYPPDLFYSADINSVDLNISGFGLIGGINKDNTPYIAHVSSGGTPTILDPGIGGTTGFVQSVAINESGLGIIGGREVGLNTAYAAQVLADGTVTTLSISADNIIESVDINDSGLGLIGGEGSIVAYAAYVDSGGTVTEVTGLPGAGSHIFTVSINDLGQGIIGGNKDGSGGAYAAFVTKEGGVIQELSPLPPNYPSKIHSVAINHSSIALVGGRDDSSNAIAGYSSSDGSVINLIDTPFSGTISSVAINDSGVGLIGGSNDAAFYAAIVHPDHSLQQLTIDPTLGSINSVDIIDSGLGLIGGQTSGSTGYAALVAPGGQLTPLDITTYTINSVALNASTILEQATPQSVGPYQSTIYAQLAASAALENRFLQNKRKKKGTVEEVACNEISFGPKTEAAPLKPAPAPKSNSIWLEPFGNYIHVKDQGKIPNFTNTIGGALLGYDHQGSNYMVGAVVGYAYDYVQIGKGVGHTNLQEEVVSLYGLYSKDHFWFDVAVWGGLYQYTNERHTLSIATSKGRSHGWLLQPHLELASPWALDKNELYYIEPFAQLDWVNNWQHSYTESGSSGLNLHLPSIYNSLLQSEAGLRFYERIVCGWGDVCLEEKLSYVNQAPFGTHSTNTSFVASASSFPIDVAITTVQNMGSVQFLTCFVPNNPSYPYGGFSVQATAGSSYQSYFGSVFTGVDF